ncbi:MAG: hypothetical protein HYT39_04045 [Candidatus Sungbacteria bacterium]|nr:hypothetical protein [Candidatus Sungbacteria bacterium]
MNDAPETVSIRKQRWFYGGLLIAAVNPILSGLIVGILMMLEQNMRKEGRIITAFSIIWGLIVLLLVAKYGPAFKP